MGSLPRQVSEINVMPAQQIEGSSDDGGMAKTLFAGTLQDAYRQIEARLARSGRAAVISGWGRPGFNVVANPVINSPDPQQYRQGSPQRPRPGRPLLPGNGHRGGPWDPGAPGRPTWWSGRAGSMDYATKGA